MNKGRATAFAIRTSAKTTTTKNGQNVQRDHLPDRLFNRPKKKKRKEKKRKSTQLLTFTTFSFVVTYYTYSFFKFCRHTTVHSFVPVSKTSFERKSHTCSEIIMN